MSEILRCLVIEDEPLAQNILKKFISEHPVLELAGVFDDAISAQVGLQQPDIDLVFLDINMPKLSGINLVKTIPKPPMIIFTTAYPEYAVEGFEMDAIDYLLKPFSFERFLKAVNKALEKKRERAYMLSPENSVPVSVFWKSNKKIHRISLRDILYVEAIGDYMKVVMESETILVNDTMKNIQEELPKDQFLRVHKSFIVALDRIRYVEGGYLRVGETGIPIGNTYRDEISAYFRK